MNETEIHQALQDIVSRWVYWRATRTQARGQSTAEQEN